MIYSEKYVFIVYIIAALLLIGLICFVSIVNVGDYLHNYKSSGTICAYYGVVAPNGWVICDGRNGTPDLRGKFVYGGNKFSQLLYKSYLTTIDNDFYNFTQQIEGGNNYQTLTTKTKNIDGFRYIKPNDIPNSEYFGQLTNSDIISANTQLDANDIIIDKMILSNPNIVSTKPQIFNTLYTVNDQNKEFELFDAKIQNKSDEEIETIKQNDLETRIESVKDELKQFIAKDVENGDDITEEELENVENQIDVVEEPEYLGYKYPSNKTITADNNLPPYYSLIFIMKL